MKLKEWLALPVCDGGVSSDTLSEEQTACEYSAFQQMCCPLSEDIGWEECERMQRSIACQIRCYRL